MKQQSAVIIGAGTGGLAIANLLAKSGWSVTVFEKGATAGGRVGSLEADGFRFDSGPSWYLMPEVFEHYFSLLDEKTTDYYQLQKLTPAYKVFYDYHKPITITGNLQIDSKTFESVEPGSGTRLRSYVDDAERTYNIAMKHFLYNPFSDLKTLSRLEIIKQSSTLTKQLLTPLHKYAKQFTSSLPLQQILEYPMVFLGTSPFKAPALYHLMSYIDFKQGVFYPKQGMYSLIEAMTKIGRKLGVVYHFNQPVSQIISADGRATGVTTKNGKTFNADIVISNADLHFTETKLLKQADQTYPEKFWKRKTAGPSALLMYLGVRGSLPSFEHHNLFFVKEWRKNFSDIFEAKKWPEPASIYVSKTTATDKSVAPKGQENIFVLVPLPSGLPKDAKTTAAFADRYIDQLAELADIPDLKERITYKKFYGPEDFSNQFNSWEGTALGMAHLLRQSAFFRPAPRSKKLKNLWYVGAGTQPGIGLPMCLISAELIYKQLIGDRTAGRLKNLNIPEEGGWNV